ncbi:MAG: hypothetical protein EBV28_07820 [Betaproteobacteria bacterium]|nr:hypothetical protein [Betaproteobacteria bacterium]
MQVRGLWLIAGGRVLHSRPGAVQGSSLGRRTKAAAIGLPERAVAPIQGAQRPNSVLVALRPRACAPKPSHFWGLGVARALR